MWRGTILLCCMEWDLGMWPLYSFACRCLQLSFSHSLSQETSWHHGYIADDCYIVGTGDGGLAYISFLHAAISWCSGSHWWTRTSGVFNSHGKWHIPRQYGNETELHTVQSPIDPLGFPWQLVLNYWASSNISHPYFCWGLATETLHPRVLLYSREQEYIQLMCLLFLLLAYKSNLCPGVTF